MFAVAIVAIDWPITARLEGHLGGGAAFIANHGEHLALATALVAAVGTAGGAAAGLVLEAFFSVEGLLGCGEGEFGAALAAGQGFVGVHAYMSLLDVCQTDAILVPWSRHQFPDEHRRNT